MTRGRSVGIASAPHSGLSIHRMRATRTRAISRLPRGKIASVTCASVADTGNDFAFHALDPSCADRIKFSPRVDPVPAFRFLPKSRRPMTIFQQVSSLIVLAMVWLSPAAPSSAQDYPSRPVKMIVPFGAGGPTDIFTRALGEELRKALKEPFVMENRPGAGTIIGSEAAAKSPPDGYTLLMISATQTTTETLVPNKSFKLMRDFVPVASLLNSELVMVVHPSVSVNTVKDFIALAKSKPGALNYASSGVGSNYHMAGELFKNLTGTDIVHVPYKGSAGARNDIISGQIEMMFDSVPSMAPMIQAGRVKALGTTGKVRSAILPDIPTLSEDGVPGYEATIWIGVMAPAGTPQPIVTLLSSEINKILARADVIEAWRKQGATAMSMTPDQFGEYVQSEIDKWARVIKANGIKPE